MASPGDEYDPDAYIEHYIKVHKIIISCIVYVDELLKRGPTQCVGDWLKSNHLEEIQYLKTYLHKIVNELEEGYRINLEIKAFKLKFGVKLEDFNTYNISLSPMTEYPAANSTLLSQLREILTSENDLITTMTSKFVSYTNFVEFKNIILQAGKNKWTIVLIVGGACILALAGYCIDNAYTAGKDRKAKMEHLLEFRKQIDDKQILEDLISRNRLNKIRLQTLENNVRIENQQIMRSGNRYNFQIMDNYSGKAYQPYHVKEYNSLQYSSRGNYRRTNSCDPRIDSNSTRSTNNRGDGRVNNDYRSTNNRGDGRVNNDYRSANNSGARMDNNNARSTNNHDDSMDYYNANSYDSMDYYSANSCDTWIDGNSAKRANSYDDSRNNYSANQFI